MMCGIGVQQIDGIVKAAECVNCKQRNIDFRAKKGRLPNYETVSFLRLDAGEE